MNTNENVGGFSWSAGVSDVLIEAQIQRGLAEHSSALYPNQGAGAGDSTAVQGRVAGRGFNSCTGQGGGAGDSTAVQGRVTEQGIQHLYRAG